MSNFKFDLGALVLFKAGVEECRMMREGGDLSLPTIYMVTAQVVDTCAGGSQRAYVVSRLGASHRAMEAELVLSSEFDVEAALDRWVAAKHLMEKTRNELFNSEYKIAHPEKPS